MIEKEEFSIVSRDGTQLEGHEYLVPNPKGLVCLIHGLGEHAGRYEHVAQFFCEHQFSFFIIDLRGHGLSEGKKGHSPSYEALLDDVEELLMYTRAEYNDLPMFLYGHSLGGNLVTNYCLLRNTNELKGAIVSSPWLTLKEEPPKWKIGLARKVAKIWPSFSQSNELEMDQLTNDPAVNQAYREDNFVHDRISVQMFSESYLQGKWALDNTDRLKLPLFVFHGENDAITNPEGSKLLSELRKDLIDFKLYPETKHEGHNDQKKEAILSDIKNWIDQKL
ncbi:alpha/beta hydrolase [Reichenbachiella ulvae]|uniref:Lysophospholipase n=1 Tax=Reichenbachiella ulvae TaxID=2980104 RepID=A0ABT3CYR1_9BACT|nr:alpha/beta hydrolase [Reichenbachiella ulvae]MCV9388348.1 lysophospholipase [Reichenbachiella ulvae]